MWTEKVSKKAEKTPQTKMFNNISTSISMCWISRLKSNNQNSMTLPVMPTLM